jgi:voltage-gated potassium channel
VTDSAGRQPGASPEARPSAGKIVRAALRALGSSAALVVIYYLLPLGHASTGAAVTMLVMATISAGNFSQPITRTNALYFAVTVFATVGFGDITAKTEAAQLVVTGQMIVDLIILGLGARVIVGAVTRGRQRRPPDAGATRPDE